MTARGKDRDFREPSDRAPLRVQNGFKEIEVLATLCRFWAGTSPPARAQRSVQRDAHLRGRSSIDQAERSRPRP
jgi:hypothetical protein